MNIELRPAFKLLKPNFKYSKMINEGYAIFVNFHEYLTIINPQHTFITVLYRMYNCTGSSFTVLYFQVKVVGCMLNEFFIYFIADICRQFLKYADNQTVICIPKEPNQVIIGQLDLQRFTIECSSSQW